MPVEFSITLVQSFSSFYNFLHLLFILYAILIDDVIVVITTANLIANIEQLSKPVFMFETLVKNVEQRMRFQVLADVLEERAVLFGRREISRTLADELSELSRNSAPKVRVVW